MKNFLLAVLAVVVAFDLEAGVTADEARQLFERIKSLEGSWRGRSTKGWEDTKSVRVIAGGSVVMSTSFDAHPGETMATMWAMDGDRLLLTHYCVAKNQPRLVATAYDHRLGTATFEFLDATGMKDRNSGHMDKVVVKFIDADRYTLRWTWYAGGSERWLEEIEYVRVKQ